MIIDEIRLEITNARKNGNTKTLIFLSTVLGEMQLKAPVINGVKSVDDILAQTVIQKFIKNNNEFIALSNDETTINSLKYENSLLVKYLPKQLSEIELRNVIKEQIDLGKNLGQIMGYLKDNFNGQYDGKIASTIVREMN